MLLDGAPSWRQRNRPQPVNQAQNLSEQSSGDSDFRELKGDIPAMANNFGADLDQLLPQAGLYASRPEPADLSQSMAKGDNLPGQNGSKNR